ncbi:uncharacterized protein TNCV_925931 [Trichonephila clavipes]|nr:uncharacterized protein TNCV_925931 [Trichonephila clavipes]
MTSDEARASKAGFPRGNFVPVNSFSAATPVAERHLSGHLLSEASNIKKKIIILIFVNYMSLERQNLKNVWDKRWPDLEGEKDLNDDHREEITDFSHSIPGFQKCDEEVETWMACDAEDCGFQILNDDEIVTSVRRPSRR